MQLVCTLTFVHLGNSDKITKTDDGAVSNWQTKENKRWETFFCSLSFDDIFDIGPKSSTFILPYTFYPKILV